MKEFPPQIEKEILQIFEMFSIEGEIENEKLSEALNILGIELKTKEKKEKLNFDEFLEIIQKNFNTENDKIIQGFDLFDFDKTGYLTAEKLKMICQELNEEISDKEILEMIQLADPSGGGKVSFQHFFKLLKK
jgi:Ca2+-binding EF-hand superfamily protein